MKNLNEDIKNIQKAINDNTLVVFVGAGVSANSGVPTWKKLINTLAKDLGIEKEIQANEYLKIAQYYYNKNKKNIPIKSRRDFT